MEEGYELPDDDDELQQTLTEPVRQSKPTTPPGEDHPLTLSQLEQPRGARGPPQIPPPVKSALYSAAAGDKPAVSMMQRDEMNALATKGLSQSQTVDRGVPTKKAGKGKRRQLRSVKVAQRRATTPSVFRVFQDPNSVSGPPKSRQHEGGGGASAGVADLKVGKKTSTLRGSLRPTSASTRK